MRRPATKSRSAGTSTSKAATAVKKASATKPVAPSAPVAPTEKARPQKPAKMEKPAKVRRKPVRDSFTMPEADFGLIATLKARALAAQRETKKSELLRAGLHALAALPTPALVAALEQLDPVKIGRPSKG
ncbi:MAG: hypothetical protein JNK55_03035 [Rubrivivax sp.]|nr:hypothetical protein [Rubrivivax sp.]